MDATTRWVIISVIINSRLGAQTDLPSPCSSAHLTTCRCAGGGHVWDPSFRYHEALPLHVHQEQGSLLPFLPVTGFTPIQGGETTTTKENENFNLKGPNDRTKSRLDHRRRTPGGRDKPLPVDGGRHAVFRVSSGGGEAAWRYDGSHHRGEEKGNQAKINYVREQRIW